MSIKNLNTYSQYSQKNFFYSVLLENKSIIPISWKRLHLFCESYVHQLQYSPKPLKRKPFFLINLSKYILHPSWGSTERSILLACNCNRISSNASSQSFSASPISPSSACINALLTYQKGMLLFLGHSFKIL